MGTTVEQITCAALTTTGTPKTTEATAKLEEYWLPYQLFLHSQTSGAATTLVGGGVGAPVTAGELVSTGAGGIFLDAATDELGIILPIPYDMDVTAACSFEVPMHFAAVTATGDTLTLGLKYRQLTANTTALAIGNTAASPDFGARAWAVDDAVHVATGATIAANTFTNGRYVTFLITVTTFTNFSASEVSFLGMKWIYTKRHL